MRLTTDNNPAAFEVDRLCLACGQLGQLSRMVIDLDGPAFEAYYHIRCLPVCPESIAWAKTRATCLTANGLDLDAFDRLQKGVL